MTLRTIKYIEGSDAGLGSWLMNWVYSSRINLINFFFLDSLAGFVTGANGLILKSVNGGNKWISLSSGTGFQSGNDVLFVRDLNKRRYGCLGKLLLFLEGRKL